MKKWLLIFLMMIPALVSAETYYVRENATGTKATATNCTLARAMSPATHDAQTYLTTDKIVICGAITNILPPSDGVKYVANNDLSKIGGMTLTDRKGIVFEHITFNGCITGSGGRNITFRNCKIGKCNSGVQFTSTGNIEMEQNTILTPLKITGGKDHVIAMNVIRRVAKGVIMTNADGVINNNWMRGRKDRMLCPVGCDCEGDLSAAPLECKRYCSSAAITVKGGSAVNAHHNDIKYFPRCFIVRGVNTILNTSQNQCYEFSYDAVDADEGTINTDGNMLKSTVSPKHHIRLRANGTYTGQRDLYKPKTTKFYHKNQDINSLNEWKTITGQDTQANDGEMEPDEIQDEEDPADALDSSDEEAMTIQNPLIVVDKRGRKK